jgi:DNA repair exonuclease SbcCD ATPase subunit
MKFLKKYSLFLEQDDISDDITPTSDNNIIDSNDKANSDALQSIKKDFEEFKSKKSSVESIFSKLEKTDSEVDDELQKNVFNNQKDSNKRNKYLTLLTSLYKLKRRVDKIILSIEKDKEKQSEVQKQISDLIDRFNQLQNSDQKAVVDSQRKKSEEYLKEIKMKITQNQKELSLSEKNYEKKKEDFEKTMQVEEEKIKNLEK